MSHEPRPSMRSPRRAFAFLGAAVVLVTAGAPARAQTGTEPYNNNNPDDHGPNTAAIFHYAEIATGSSGWQLGPSGDVDWFVLTCSQSVPSSPPRFVDKVTLDIWQGSGDLDLSLYTPWQTWIGGSYGTTNLERVTVSGSRSSVYAKVHGYAGATGTYSISFTCR